MLHSILRKDSVPEVSSPEHWSTREIMQRVSETDIQFLIQTGEDESRMHWRWGDMANKWIKEGLPAMWVYKTVGELVGRKTSSIRNYAYVARRFTDATREEYGILKFEHFKFALMCENSKEVLDYAVGVAPERGGRPASVDELKGVFRGLRTLVIDDEDTFYVASAATPSWGIPIARRIAVIGDPEARSRIDNMFQSLIKAIEEVTPVKK